MNEQETRQTVIKSVFTKSHKGQIITRLTNSNIYISSNQKCNVLIFSIYLEWHWVSLQIHLGFSDLKTQHYFPSHSGIDCCFRNLIRRLLVLLQLLISPHYPVFRRDRIRAYTQKRSCVRLQVWKGINDNIHFLKTQNKQSGQLANQTAVGQWRTTGSLLIAVAAVIHSHFLLQYTNLNIVLKHFISLICPFTVWIAGNV